VTDEGAVKPGPIIDTSIEGKVKHLSQEKGYGFIAVKGKPDVFFHVSDLRGVPLWDLKEGTPLVFDVEQTARQGRPSYRARNVRGVE